MELPPAHRVRSSIFYYFVLQLNMLWNVVNTIILIVLQALKLYTYPASKLDREFQMVAPFLLFVLVCAKIAFAKPGNRSESFLFIILAIVFMIPSVVMDVYFLIWQPYVWSWEEPLHYVSIAFEGIFLIFSIVMIIIFILKK